MQAILKMSRISLGAVASSFPRSLQAVNFPNTMSNAGTDFPAGSTVYRTPTREMAMSTELRPTRPESAQSSTKSRQVAAPVKKESFQNVVKATLEDSQVAPHQYLDEVVVQKGGE